MTINPHCRAGQLPGPMAHHKLILALHKGEHDERQADQAAQKYLFPQGMPVTYLLQASPAANNRALSSIKATQYHEDFAFFAIVVLSFHITAPFTRRCILPCWQNPGPSKP